MELGNMLFGNSRGSFEVPRSLVDSKEWEELVHFLIQVEDYHCSIDKKYYQDYSTSNLEYKERTSPIPPNEFGGCSLVIDGKEIFSIFPYYWGDCTCGVEEENENLRDKWQKELFTKKEWDTYMSFDDYCKDDCPAYSFKKENINKTEGQLFKLCTCGTMQKNRKLRERKRLLKTKIDEFEKREMNDLLEHKDDCLLLRHNFVYHKGQDDEFVIDWYKYPFRDSYMNIDYDENQIKEIFKDCIKEFKNYYKL